MGSIKRAGNGVVEFVSGDVTSREMQFNDGTLRQQMPQFSSSIHSLAVIFVCRLPCFAKSLLLFRRLVFFSSSLVHQKLSPLFPRGDVGVTKTQKIKKKGNFHLAMNDASCVSLEHYRLFLAICAK
jgi:hypothetical protein